MLDIRETLRSDEGAVIFAQYQGRLDAPQGWQYPMTIYVVPRFETGDERYTWLNRIEAVGNEDLSLDYEWYEVRYLAVAGNQGLGALQATHYE
jgi:Protein of unknown function (DUF3237)